MLVPPSMTPGPSPVRRLPRLSFSVLALALCLAAHTGIVSQALAAAKSEQDMAREAWMGGYTKLEEATNAETNNQVLALDLYREALAVFEQVRARYPKWNPSLLDYRINFCRERCRRLEGAVAAQNTQLSKTDLVTLTRNQEAQVKKLSEDNLELKKRFELTAQALERARAESAHTLASDTDLQKLLQEKRDLQDACKAAQEREAALKTEVEALRTQSGLKKKTEQLQQKLDVTLAKQAELEQTAESGRKAIRGLKDQLRQASLEREQLAADNQALKDTAAQHATQQAKGDARVHALEKQMVTLEKQVALQKDDLEAAQRAADKATARIKDLTQQTDAVRDLRDRLHRTEAERDELNAKVTAQADTIAKLAAPPPAPPPVAPVAPAPVTPATPAVPATPAAPAGPDPELTRTRKELETISQQWRFQEKALANAQKRLVSLQQVETRLQEAQTRLAAVQEEAQAGTQQLKARETRIASLTKDVEATTTERNTLNTTLDTLQQKNRDLAAELNAVKRTRTSDGQSALELREKLQTSDHAKTEAETRLASLTKQQTETAQLLRRQEDRITALEQSATAQKDAVKSKDDALTETRRTLELYKDKAAAWDGMKSSLTVKEGEHAAASERLQQAEKRLALLDASVRERDEDLKRVRNELASARRTKAPENDPLLDQLRSLNRDLEREREKSKALEQTLATQTKPGTVLPSHGPAGGSSPAPDTDPLALAKSFLQLGTTAEQQGKSETAIWNYRKVLEYQGDNKLALKRLGLLAAQAGNEEDAEGYLRRAFYADPDDVDVLVPLGFALVRQGKADLAVSMLARAASLHPDDAGVHRAYGVACNTLGWYDAAEGQFRRSMELNAKDGEAAFNLAVLLAARKRPDEAKPWYRRALDLGVASDPGLDKLLGKPSPR